MSIPEIDTPTLKKRLDDRAAGKDRFHLLDVRNPHEQEIALIPGTDRLIPVGELEARLSELEDWKNDGQDLIVYCRSGGRSGNAVALLLQKGFQNCYNVKGGTLAYSDLVDPSMKKY